jgi:hypothetical protein
MLLKANEDLIEAWRDRPNKEIAVIIHVDGPADQHVDVVEAHGISVVRAFRLTNTIAARGAAGQVLRLLDEPWVQMVEMDQTVTTFR